MNGTAWIEPEAISFRRNEDGWLEAGWNGRAGCVSAARLFPVTAPDGMIRISGTDGEDWGVIRCVSGLDPESRRALEAEIRLNPFLPVIRSVAALRKRDRCFEWETLTDFGSFRFITSSLYEAVSEQENGARVVTDLSGQQYVLPGGILLDRRSRKRIGRWI